MGIFTNELERWLTPVEQAPLRRYPALPTSGIAAPLPRGEQRVRKRSGCLRGKPAAGSAATEAERKAIPKRARAEPQATLSKRKLYELRKRTATSRKLRGFPHSSFEAYAVARAPHTMYFVNVTTLGPCEG